MPDEEPIVFYVDECSLCSGSVKKENKLTPYHFRGFFM